MKPILSVLLFLASVPVIAQSDWSRSDSAYYAPPPTPAMLMADTLKQERRAFVSTATENTLLRRQNERLMNRESRFWAVVILAVVAIIVGVGK